MEEYAGYVVRETRLRAAQQSNSVSYINEALVRAMCTIGTEIVFDVNDGNFLSLKRSSKSQSNSISDVFSGLMQIEEYNTGNVTQLVTQILSKNDTKQKFTLVVQSSCNCQSVVNETVLQLWKLKRKEESKGKVNEDILKEMAEIKAKKKELEEEVVESLSGGTRAIEVGDCSVILESRERPPGKPSQNQLRDMVSNAIAHVIKTRSADSNNEDITSAIMKSVTNMYNTPRDSKRSLVAKVIA